MIPSAAIQLLDVAGEAAVRTLAENAGVPVPHIHHVCGDESVLGGPFFLSTAVDGESVPRRVLRLAHEHGVGERVVEQIGNALACLHSVDPASAPSVLPRPTGPGPVATIMTTVNTLLDGLLDPSPVFSYGVRWLERNAPTEPDRMTVVHTDVRTGNIIVGEDGLRAVLDWETARIGDPMEDLAWPCQRMWRFREDSSPGRRSGLDRHPPPRLRGGRRHLGRGPFPVVAGAGNGALGTQPGRPGPGASRRQLPVDRDGGERPKGARARVRHAAAPAPALTSVGGLLPTISCPGEVVTGANSDQEV